MTAINPNTKFTFVLVIFVILMIFFAAVFAGIINTVDKDNYNKNKDTYNGIAITSIILIALLGIISFVAISKDPTIFGPYVLITTHLSLLLSILSVTFSSFKL